MGTLKVMNVAGKPSYTWNMCNCDSVNNLFIRE